MKTVFLLLFTSILALVAVAALASRPVPHGMDGAPPDPARRIVEWRDIKGGRAILPPRFVPPPSDATTAADARKPARDPSEASPNPLVARWSLPLMDRSLTTTERTDGLAADLQEAINRLEPIFDPTRLDGPLDAVPLRVSAGSASLDDVFGEHWHLASDDPNIEIRVSSVGLAWRLAALLPCDFFIKRRPREVGDLALDSLTPEDCARIMRRRAKHFDDSKPMIVVSAPISLPAFAAPPPGARLSSGDFWAAQKARVEAVEARLQQRWDSARPPPSEARATP